VGSLLEDARQVAEADAPADEAVPVGVAVEVVVHDLGEAQDDVPEEGRVLHHVGVRCGDSRPPRRHAATRTPVPTALPGAREAEAKWVGSPVRTGQRGNNRLSNRRGPARVWSGYTGGSSLRRCRPQEECQGRTRAPEKGGCQGPKRTYHPLSSRPEGTARREARRQQ